MEATRSLPRFSTGDRWMRPATVYLQAFLVLVAMGVLAFMLREPHLEGRNAHATNAQIYFHDPFLAYAYASSIAFFIAMFQAFRLLGYIRHGNVFSRKSVDALRTIRRCALILVALIVTPVLYLFIVRPGDDMAGGVAMGLMLILVSLAGAALSHVLGKVLQGATDMGAETA